jgi:ankyrin repeat protein
LANKIRGFIFKLTEFLKSLFLFDATRWMKHFLTRAKSTDCFETKSHQINLAAHQRDWHAVQTMLRKDGGHSMLIYSIRRAFAHNLKEDLEHLEQQAGANIYQQAIRSMPSMIEELSPELRAKLSSSMSHEVVGVNIETLDSMLAYAAEDGRTREVKTLLEYGANVHVLDDGPLRMAANRGHFVIVQMLVESGANVRANNDDASRSAAQNSHWAIVRLLTANGAAGCSQWSC